MTTGQCKATKDGNYLRSNSKFKAFPTSAQKQQMWHWRGLLITTKRSSVWDVTWNICSWKKKKINGWYCFGRISLNQDMFTEIPVQFIPGCLSSSLQQELKREKILTCSCLNSKVRSITCTPQTVKSQPGICFQTSLKASTWTAATGLMKLSWSLYFCISQDESLTDLSFIQLWVDTHNKRHSHTLHTVAATKNKKSENVY